MKLFISFSARKNGNCDNIARFLSSGQDKIIFFRDMKYRSCGNCDYECFADVCKYRGDDVYGIFEDAFSYDKIVLIVPMYCGNPSSLYFAFNERSQDYFMHNEDKYNDLIKKLFIIGVYGDKEKSPDFIPCLEKWFDGSKYSNHVFGIERHKYNLKLKDSVLEIGELRTAISEFVNPTIAKQELSAMAVVLCGDNILVTNETIYGKETLSLPKGHNEEGENIIETAIRECFEETDIVICKDDFVERIESFSYEFLTPANKFIKKTIVPLVFRVKKQAKPAAKEERMIWVKWMSKEEFLDKCTHENVKTVVKSI